MPQPLANYHIKARNTAAAGENVIHDDAAARRYGFLGGLVPGVTLYAYLTEPLVATLGVPWLDRGTATVHFVRPVLDGEEVTVSGAVTGRDAGGVSVTLTAATPQTGPCAVTTATLPAAPPTPVNVALYGTAPLPAERPVVSRQLLERPGPLGTIDTLYDAERASAFLGGVEDPLPLYRGADGCVHPAFFLDQANRALDQNVRLGPWILVSSRVRHLRLARMGERLITRARVRSLYEKRRRQYVELDVLVGAGPAARPVAHVLHTAIYQLSIDA